MKYEIEYDQKNDCLVGRFQGVLRNSSFYSAYIEELREKAQEHDCTRILHDFRTVSMEMSILEIHVFSNTIRDEKIDPRWKRAMVVAEQFVKDGHFFETVAVNRGHRIRFFTGYDQAVNWLKE
jgi:hypothetical protein